MKFDVEDLKRLQWAIAMLVILSLAGAASVWTTLQMRDATNKSVQQASTARKDIQAKLARARDEEKDLREKIIRFQALQAKGYIGPEKRLEWIEAVARAKTALRISKLDYELLPQRPIDASILPGGAAAGGFEIMASSMRLQLNLLHEGELLAFLTELRNSVQALIQIRSCTLERLPPSRTDRGIGAQIKAECNLEWITLKEAK